MSSSSSSSMVPEQAPPEESNHHDEARLCDATTSSQQTPEPPAHDAATAAGDGGAATLPYDPNTTTIHINADSVYSFYREQLWPAVAASWPFLWRRICEDAKYGLHRLGRASVEFLLPSWMLTSGSDGGSDGESSRFPYARWPQLFQSAPPSMQEWMLRHFDNDGDGHISRIEFLNLSAFVEAVALPHVTTAPPPPMTWWLWFTREWPLMDWKMGVFLWRTFGGILIVVTVCSIIPGRLHGWAARILRWPVLALVYFLILVELCVYVVIRVFIRLAEYSVARPKHRHLRRCMASARSYAEWNEYAAALDRSQQRHVWLRRLDDTTSRYNWGFVLELLHDLKAAKRKGDAFLALAVLQQCTRKNVGGVMSEDLFSYSNTGEPKYVVTEFVQEVEATIRWVTEQAMLLPIQDAVADGSDGTKNANAAAAKSSDIVANADGIAIDSNTGEALQEPVPSTATDQQHKMVHDERLQQEVRNEKDKLWKSLIDATLNVLDRGNSNSSSTSSNSSQHSGNGGTGAGGGAGNVSSKDVNMTSQTDPCAESNRVAVAPPPSPAAAAAASNKGGQTPAQLLHRAEVLAFLKRARAAYGRTALCLSGGAMMGLYHLGHLAALLETGMLPHIISGTSAGSVIGAIVCTRTDEELKEALKPEVLAQHLVCFRRPWKERFQSVWKNGHMFDFDEWMELIQWFTCGNMTFLEAYKKTGRVFCITLSSTTKKAPPVLLNHLTAPDVVIASAVVASAAVPGCIPPVRLLYKQPDGTLRGSQTRGKEEAYFDGSIRQDIPVNGLAEMLNCQFFIACQCNPHIVPFFFGNKGHVGRPSRWSSGTQESSWRGGFLLGALEMYLKNDMKAKFVFLNDVEAAVGFTSTLMTQDFVGSTTIVPQVQLWDYTRLFRDPKLDELYDYYQRGAVAAYEHIAMIKLHYSVADALDQCIAKLEGSRSNLSMTKRRRALHIERRRPVIVSPPPERKSRVRYHHHNDDDDDIHSEHEEDYYDEDHTPPPSILNIVLGSLSSPTAGDDDDKGDTAAPSLDAGSTAGFSRDEEYSRDWVDLDH